MSATEMTRTAPILILAFLVWGLEETARGTQSDPNRNFRSEAAYVQLSVVATDRNGRPITDLQVGDIEVLEDGHRQLLTKFTANSSVVRPRPAGNVTVSRSASAQTDTQRSAYLVVIDSFHLSIGQMRQVESAVRQFLTRYLQPSNLAAVVVLGSSPRASIFSSNLATALTSLDKTSRSGSARVGEGAIDLGSKEANEWFSAATGAGDSSLAETSLAQLAIAARTLGELRGVRKNVLFFSEGIGTDLFATANPQARSAAERVLRAQQSFISAASAADVSVYPIDVRGLAAIDPFSTGEPGGLTEWESLRVLADGTGGIAFVGRRNFDPVFQKIVEDAANYYEIGYYSTTPSDNKYHSLEVKSLRPDVAVRARSATPSRKSPATDPPMALTIASILNRALPVDNGGLILKASAMPREVQGNETTIAIRVEVASWGPADSLPATNELSLPQLGLAAYAPSGARLLERVVELPSKGHSVATTIKVPRTLLQIRVAALADGGRLQGSLFLDLDLRPGGHR